MKQSLDLNRMGLMPMSSTEIQETEGGLLEELAIAAAVFLVTAAYEAGKNAYAYDKAHSK